MCMPLQMENCEGERNFCKLLKTEDNQAGENTELSFYFLYRKRYYKVIVI
jgi:hypothetical protein